MSRKREVLAETRVGKLELLLYDACVAYQNARRQTASAQKRMMLRGKIRGLAEALVWTSEAAGGAMPHITQIKATEAEFMRRAKNDPPF